jgi:hypothetical protein
VDDSGNLEGTVAEPGSGGGASPGTTTTGAGTPRTGAVKGAPATGSPARAARVTLPSRRLQASRTGAVRLRLSCPRRAQICRARVRLRRAGRTVAAARLTIAGGATAAAKLVLRRSVRERLMRAGALRVIAVIAARNADGARTTTSTAIRLLAPRRADRPLP